MDSKCETVGKYLLPLFRSLVAKELISAYKFTQTEVADKLGTTQAAISNYVNSKRALKISDQMAPNLPKILKIANATAQQLSTKQATWAEVESNFCKLCSDMLEPDTNTSDYMI